LSCIVSTFDFEWKQYTVINALYTLVLVYLFISTRRRKASMINYKAYLINLTAVGPFVAPLLYYFHNLYVNMTYWIYLIYGEENSLQRKLAFYLTLAIPICLIIFKFKAVSQFIEKIMELFSSYNKTSPYSRTNIWLQYLMIVRLIPVKMVLLVLIYLTLIFYQCKIREMLLYA